MANRSEGDAKQGTLAGLWLTPTTPRHTCHAEPATCPRTSDLEPAPGSASAPWSVRELVNDLRRHVEATYSDLWVAGEISNCHTALSGHIYFTLKDGEAQLPVVLFRRQAHLLHFRPQDGIAVLARGRVSVYESRGQLQLIAETLEPRGAGALQLAFEQLKVRLLAEGLFDAGRKRQLPAYPRSVGVITSTSGAVLHDIVKVVRRRHARLSILIYPATMQGNECAASVADGIAWFNRNQPRAGRPSRGRRNKETRNRPPGKVDLILIARGGGSLEDLAGFNDEALARAIAASDLPVVSAIGHETDFTIADFVADLRAATPSAAAEIVTAAQHRIEERVQALDERVRRAIRYPLILARQRLADLSAAQMQVRLQTLIGRRSQSLDDLRYRIGSTANRCLRLRANRLVSLATRLERHHPAARIDRARLRYQAASQSLGRIANAAIAARATRLDRVTARLHALSPLAVLDRGYALVYIESRIESGAAAETLLRNAAEAHPGQSIRARLAAGSVTAEVKSIDRA